MVRSVIVIQARMGSSRLPGKVLMRIDGKCMLEWVVERALLATRITSAWVATSHLAEDDAIAAWCESYGVGCYRGSESDVLGRYLDAISNLDETPEIVVRLTADCPFTDPSVVDQCVETLAEDDELGYAATRRPDGRTFPIGIDVEAFRSSLLRIAAAQSIEPHRREHVTPWFYDGGYDGPVAYLEADGDFSAERWTVDTIDDLNFVRAVAPHIKSYDWKDIAEFIANNPQLRDFNSHVIQKNFKMTSDSDRNY